jgi:hypothetical protein
MGPSILVIYLYRKFVAPIYDHLNTNQLLNLTSLFPPLSLKDVN